MISQDDYCLKNTEILAPLLVDLKKDDVRRVIIDCEYLINSKFR